MPCRWSTSGWKYKNEQKPKFVISLFKLSLTVVRFLSPFSLRFRSTVVCLRTLSAFVLPTARSSRTSMQQPSSSALRCSRRTPEKTSLKDSRLTQSLLEMTRQRSSTSRSYPRSARHSIDLPRFTASSVPTSLDSLLIHSE